MEEFSVSLFVPVTPSSPSPSPSLSHSPNPNPKRIRFDLNRPDFDTEEEYMDGDEMDSDDNDNIPKEFKKVSLKLTLSPPSTKRGPLSPPPTPSPSPPPQPPQPEQFQPPPPPPPPPLILLQPHPDGASPSAPGQDPIVDPPPPTKSARLSNQGNRGKRVSKKGGSQDDGKDGPIEAVFLWATDKRAEIHTMDDLLSKGIVEISSEVQCKRCEARLTMNYDLKDKFWEVARFIKAKKGEMHDRAPPEWMNPTFPDCAKCRQTNCMRPVISPKKRSINWLLMLLGQTLGCCTLEHLKYFCKHAKYHRTGAKDRVLYYTFLGLCKQLAPAHKLFET